MKLCPFDIVMMNNRTQTLEYDLISSLLFPLDKNYSSLPKCKCYQDWPGPPACVQCVLCAGAVMWNTLTFIWLLCPRREHKGSVVLVVFVLI